MWAAVLVLGWSNDDITVRTVPGPGLATTLLPIRRYVPGQQRRGAASAALRHHRRAPPRARSSCRDSPTQKRWRAGPRPPLPAGRPQLRGRSADTARRGECRPGTVVMVMFQSCPTNVNTSCCDNWDLCFHVQPQ